MRDAVKPNVEFEELCPADLSSALRSLSWSGRDGLIHAPIGAGFECFLRWSVEDIEAAQVAGDNAVRARHSTNAVMSARRSLSCLVDQYLRRDGIAHCRDAPKDARAKSRVLQDWDVLDALAAQVLDRAIGKRNEAEHGYRILDFEEAQDIVHIVRTTVHTLTTTNLPYDGPCIFGSFNHTHYFANGEHHFIFQGWHDPVVIVALFDSQPWIGVVIPASETTATARRCPIKKLSVDELLEVLRILNDRQSHSTSRSSARIWRGISQSAGLSSGPEVNTRDT